MRLSFSYGVMLVLFIFVVALIVLQVRQMASNNEQFARNDIQRLLTVQALTLETEGVGNTLLLIFSTEWHNRVTEYKAIDQKKQQIDQLIDELEKSLSETEQQIVLKDLIAARDRFQAAHLKMLDEFELNGAEAAKPIFIREVEPARRALLGESAALLTKEKARINARLRSEQDNLHSVQITVIFISLFAIVFGIFVALITRNSVVRPLAFLEESALQIAAGNYYNKVPPSKTIEVERVGNALNSMAEAIAAREEEIEQLAYYDPLTHLPNRTLLLKNLDNADLSNKSMILMDIARLKTVNETLGFGTGDTVILESSRRIQQALVNVDTGTIWLAKFAGGMFAVLYPSDNPKVINDLITEIDLNLNEPIRCGQYTVDVNFIYGIATSASNIITLNTLVRNAEVALYAAKASTQVVVWYSDAQEASRLSHLSLLSDLRLAVLNSELQMWLQPKVHLATMKTFGFEALVRWQHPLRGFISPVDFVPFAERTGYISTVTKWMLEKALQTLQQWKQHHPLLSIAVNVSTNDLRDQLFPDRVRDLLEKYAIDPQRIKLELTESGIMEDPASSIPLLQKLRDTGIGLSIDDFGTGHSSLAYLQKLPVTELKIDRSFVINIDQLPSTQRLVKTIIEMGHGLNLTVIAEGIETQAERDTLLSLGCDSMQGYFASKPLHGEALATWLSRLHAPENAKI